MSFDYYVYEPKVKSISQKDLISLIHNDTDNDSLRSKLLTNSTKNFEAFLDELLTIYPPLEDEIENPDKQKHIWSVTPENTSLFSEIYLTLTWSNTEEAKIIDRLAQKYNLQTFDPQSVPYEGDTSILEGSFYPQIMPFSFGLLNSSNGMYVSKSGIKSKNAGLKPFHVLEIKMEQIKSIAIENKDGKRLLVFKLDVSFPFKLDANSFKKDVLKSMIEKILSHKSDIKLEFSLSDI